VGTGFDGGAIKGGGERLSRVIGTAVIPVCSRMGARNHQHATTRTNNARIVTFRAFMDESKLPVDDERLSFREYLHSCG
jgi:hypothetical protein